MIVTPAMIEAGRKTARTLYLRDVADDPLWPDAISRIHASMERARSKPKQRYIEEGVHGYYDQNGPGR